MSSFVFDFILCYAFSFWVDCEHVIDSLAKCMLVSDPLNNTLQAQGQVAPSPTASVLHVRAFRIWTARQLFSLH